VNKLLGLLVLGLAFTLGFGTVGCSKKEEKKDEKPAAKDDEAAKKKKADEEAAAKKKKEEAEKLMPTLTADGGEATIAKTMKTKKEVEIKLDKDAPEKVTLSAKIKSEDGKKDADLKVTAAGEIAKGSKAGTLTLTVGDADIAPGVYMVEVTSKEAKGTAKVKLTVEK